MSSAREFANILESECHWNNGFRLQRCAELIEQRDTALLRDERAREEEVFATRSLEKKIESLEARLNEVRKLADRIDGEYAPKWIPAAIRAILNREK